MASAFNNKLNTDEAFRWERSEVISFLTGLKDSPTDYGVPDPLEDYAKKAVSYIIQLWDNDQTYLKDGDVLLYEGSHLRFYTILDFLGWIFTVACTPPTADIDDNLIRAFHYPISALFAKFGLMMTSQDGAPQMVSLIFFKDESGVSRALFGATITVPYTDDEKTALKEIRHQYMGHFKIISDPTMEKAPIDYNPDNSPVPPNPVSQSFGHCAETYPFVFLQVIHNAHGFPANAVRGIAVRPSNLARKGIPESYNPKDMRKALTSACRNCEYIVDQELKLVRNNFLKKYMPSPSDSVALDEDDDDDTELDVSDDNSFVPSGWTSDPYDKEVVNKLLTKILNKQMSVKIAQEDGDMYLFESSDKKYYLWNAIADVIGLVIDPTDYHHLLRMIGSLHDFKHVKVKVV